MTCKYMIVSIFIIISTMNAMEVEKVCHLASIPAEIQNHIASYLPFNIIESDEEFIERTWQCGTISQKHADLLEQYEEQNNSEFSALKKQFPTMHFLDNTPRTYSIDCSKIISLEKSSKKPRVTIFDIQSKTKKENAKLTELSQEDINDEIKHITLSRTGSHFATLHTLKDYESGRGEVMIISYTNYLFIKNLLSQAEQKFPVTRQYSDFISIGFNKQGTKVIVHAKENGIWVAPDPKTDKPTHFHIVPLATPEEHEEKSKKTLDAYLRHICCCKSLAKDLPDLK